MPCRSWWRNCAIESDWEMLVIDRLEDAISPLAPEVVRIRKLISAFEVCHHKAERWAYNLLEAISTGNTNKGLGTRKPGTRHPAEEFWANVCSVLSAWCAGDPGAMLALVAPGLPASELLTCLGKRSTLKVWQVQRVIEKIRSFVDWPGRSRDAASPYTWLLYSEQSFQGLNSSRCPPRYRSEESLWLATVCTMIHDTRDGVPLALSLGLAIDMLWPCHWDFRRNLQIVLGAIGGNLKPDKPFTACGRNISLLPARDRLLRLADKLRFYYTDATPSAAVEGTLLAMLGPKTKVKIWLAASLEKTLRLQLDPPPEMQEASSLAAPAWLEAFRCPPLPRTAISSPRKASPRMVG